MDARRSKKNRKINEIVDKLSILAYMSHYVSFLVYKVNEGFLAVLTAEWSFICVNSLKSDGKKMFEIVRVRIF